MLNPAVPGFHPDPSICRVGADYWLACSSFEYFPGIPLFHSRDAEHWELVGHVATRPGQLGLTGVPAGMGSFAPTLRYHDGLFYLAVFDGMGRGALVFSSRDPRGPWDDGVVLSGADGIDHDLAWDADGTCYVTYSGIVFDGPDQGRHLGIQQVRMDLSTGKALTEPRSLWSGTGGKFPEGPHLYEVEGVWYLLIAEGGTARGHAVSIARGPGPEGPFEGHPANPLHTHRGTGHVVQNSGHADLARTDDGWVMVSLGTRPRGASQAFAPLGRETFQTRVTWLDGWPVIEPIDLTDGTPPEDAECDLDPSDPEWVTVRDSERAWLRSEPGRLVIAADPDLDGPAMDALHPRFLGRRPRHEDATLSAVLEPGDGRGGLSVRIDERHHYDIERDGDRIVARARIGEVVQRWDVPAPAGATLLWIRAIPAGPGRVGGQATCDTVQLGHGADGSDPVAQVDGRYLSVEVCASFTGRVWGAYATRGEAVFSSIAYRGRSRTD